MITAEQSQSEEPQTVSRALLSLGRINSIEGVVRAGFVGFYKARNLSNAPKETSDEVEYQLTRWREFCERFTKIAQLEEERARLEKWLGQKPKGKNRIASRIETYAAIISLFQQREERQEWAPKMEQLCRNTRKVMCRKVTRDEIESSLEVIRDLQRLVEERLTTDKQTSEKILSGRAPLI
jgi:hypothetical protein